MPRTKLIDGFLRKIWQEYHETMLPIDDSDDLAAFINSTPEGCVWRQLDCDDQAVRKCALTAVKQVCKLCFYVNACDPPMQMTSEGMATEVPFDAAEHVALDDKIKPGKPCVVIFPALRSHDGELKAKAQVLASDYM